MVKLDNDQQGIFNNGNSYIVLHRIQIGSFTQQVLYYWLVRLSAKFPDSKQHHDNSIYHMIHVYNTWCTKLINTAVWYLVYSFIFNLLTGLKAWERQPGQCSGSGAIHEQNVEQPVYRGELNQRPYGIWILLNCLDLVLIP